MMRFLIIVLAGILLFYSCKKDNEPIPVVKRNGDFFLSSTQYLAYPDSFKYFHLELPPPDTSYFYVVKFEVLADTLVRQVGYYHYYIPGMLIDTIDCTDAKDILITNQTGSNGVTVSTSYYWKTDTLVFHVEREYNNIHDDWNQYYLRLTPYRDVDCH